MYLAILGYVMVQTSQRERRFVARIENVGGRGVYTTCGPAWIPQAIRGRSTVFLRVSYVDLAGVKSARPFLSELKSLEQLEHLSVGETDLCDDDLSQLATLTRLHSIRLNRLPITDAGLDHLRGLRKLQELDLTLTETTAQGRNQLRQQLLNCDVTPDP